jgi:1-aminocyclopropane-1-carboxylate deaminase
MEYLPYSETPVVELRDNAVRDAGLRLLIKREDLNHESVSGNKWWKLKYNIQKAKELGKTGVLTFGGAFSNHIYATAAAAACTGLRSVGIIRGEETYPLNGTLAFARSCGMTIEYLQRSAYRQKSEVSFQRETEQRYPDYYIIPEGGTNELAVKGCREFAALLHDIPFDHLYLAVGTAGTISGLISNTSGKKSITGVAVLKNGGFLRDTISELMAPYHQRDLPTWSLETEMHHGGYAKVSSELISFVQRMDTGHQLPLDPVYTGKMLFAVFEHIRTGRFRRGDTILAIHTGGLQGAPSIMEKFSR